MRGPKNIAALVVLSLGGVAYGQSDAYRVAFEATLADPADPDKALAFAEEAVRERDYEGAIGVLERLLLMHPDAGRLKVELAGLYYRIGAYEQARSYLWDATMTGGADYETAQVILAQIDARAARHRFHAGVTATTGYQSNVNAAPADGTIVLAGMQLDLPDSNQALADGNAFGSAALRYVYDPKLDSGLTIDTTLVGAYTRYFEETDYDVGAFGLAVGPRLQLGPHPGEGASLWFYGLANLSLLGGERYGLGFGGGATMSLPATRGLWVDVVAEVAHYSYDDVDSAPTGSEQTGLAPRGAVQLRYRLFDALWVLGGGQGGLVAAEAEDQAQVFFGPLVGLSVPLPSAVGRWSIDVVYELTLLRFGEADVDVDPDTAREDTQHRVSSLVRLDFSTHWAAILSGGYTRNGSNLALYEYTALAGSGGVAFEW